MYFQLENVEIYFLFHGKSMKILRDLVWIMSAISLTPSCFQEEDVNIHQKFLIKSYIIGMYTKFDLIFRTTTSILWWAYKPKHSRFVPRTCLTLFGNKETEKLEALMICKNQNYFFILLQFFLWFFSNLHLKFKLVISK